MTTHAQASPARLPVSGIWIWMAWVAMTVGGGLVGEFLIGVLGSLLFSLIHRIVRLSLLASLARCCWEQWGCSSGSR